MKPYYSEDGFEIYHGDCREILPDIRSVDVVVTDPPYNAPDIGPNHRPSIGGGISVESYSEFCRQWFALASAKSDRMAFSSGLVHLWEYPKPRWTVCWHKPSSVSFSALGGYNTWEPILIYGKLPKGKRIVHDHVSYVPMNFVTAEWAKHPCPKQPQLWQWLVNSVSAEGETILDPFLGSGTTARAAKNLGRKCIGIERNEYFCEMAARRLSQEVFEFPTEPCTSEASSGVDGARVDDESLVKRFLKSGSDDGKAVPHD